jgi:hypothetical protein
MCFNPSACVKCFMIRHTYVIFHISISHTHTDAKYSVPSTTSQSSQPAAGPTSGYSHTCIRVRLVHMLIDACIREYTLVHTCAHVHTHHYSAQAQHPANGGDGQCSAGAEVPRRLIGLPSGVCGVVVYANRVVCSAVL